MQWHIPYGEPLSEGYWGIPTSTIDWCEENYVVSPYIAECVNTITNSGFILLAAFALANVIKQKLEARFLIVSLGFITVGIGSWLFHMTLRYEYQLLDELPMIYATCVPYWIVFSFGRSSRGSFKVGAEIALAATVLTVVYLYYRNPTIHQAGYAFLNCIIVIKSVVLSKEHVHDETARKHLVKTLVVGLTTFLSGYGIWNLDIHFCGFWRDSRRSLGMPLGFLLEGHGWWHLLTGIGVYYYVSYLEYLRQFLIGRDQLYDYEWVLGFLPRVVLKSNKEPKGSKSKLKLQEAEADIVSTRSGRKSIPSRRALEAQALEDEDLETPSKKSSRRRATTAREAEVEPEAEPEPATTRGPRTRARKSAKAS